MTSLDISWCLFVLARSRQRPRIPLIRAASRGIGPEERPLQLDSESVYTFFEAPTDRRDCAYSSIDPEHQ
jgi:hypothetical protein